MVSVTINRLVTVMVVFEVQAKVNEGLVCKVTLGSESESGLGLGLALGVDLSCGLG